MRWKRPKFLNQGIIIRQTKWVTCETSPIVSRVFWQKDCIGKPKRHGSESEQKFRLYKIERFTWWAGVRSIRRISGMFHGVKRVYSLGEKCNTLFPIVLKTGPVVDSVRPLGHWVIGWTAWLNRIKLFNSVVKLGLYKNVFMY